MIVITGAAGFIGSCLVGRLNESGMRGELMLVDDFSRTDKHRNYMTKEYGELLDRTMFLTWARRHGHPITQVVHLGARTDTACQDDAVLTKLNVHYSQEVWNLCTELKIPLIYASSAAAYGTGEYGYSDNHDLVHMLKPMSPYARSKLEFDKWVLTQTFGPPSWVGLRFFNVYGPNEYHKGRMASVVLHAFQQIKECGEVQLFRSHRADVRDGEQRRDFVYVKDAVDVIHSFMKRAPTSGIYNVGTGLARTFKDLVTCVFATLNLPVRISYVDIPSGIRGQYQYATEASICKLRAEGFSREFRSLEEGVREYVIDYLIRAAVW